MTLREDRIAYQHVSGFAPGLFIGDYEGAEWALAHDAWSVLNVLEDSDTTRYGSPYRVHRPIIARGYAQPGLLNHVAGWIEAQHDLSRPTLVHCAAGLERSPLAVAWMLARRHRWPLAKAYRMVKLPRPAIDDRTAWLPKGWEAWLRR